MRGRTNVINSTENSSGGNIEINGNIETYKIVEDNAINKGDFVSIYKDTPVVNTIQMASESKKDYALLSYAGEYDGNKFYYILSSITYKSMILLVCYSPTGEILFSTNMPASNFDSYSINEMVVVGKYIVFVKNNYSNNNNNSAISIYSIDIVGRKIEKVCEENYSDTTTSTATMGFVCAVDDERFATISKDYSTSKCKLYLYKIKNINGIVEIEMLDNIVIGTFITPIFKATGNKIVCITGNSTGSYCTIIEINEDNNLNIILDSKIGVNFNSSEKYITCVLFVAGDLFVLKKINNDSTIYVIDILNGIVKATYEKKYLNSITYYNNMLYGIVDDGMGKDFYVIFIEYLNGVFRTIKELLLFSSENEKPTIESDGLKYYMNTNTYLYFYGDKAKLFSYYYYNYNGNLYKRFFAEINMIKKGQDFVFNDDYIKQYDGSSALGVAKTGGKSGDTIEVYVPKEN